MQTLLSPKLKKIMNKKSGIKQRFSYSFTCDGHENIRATHVKTMEFTKDTDLSIQGDCIVGINADFKLDELKKFKGKVKFVLSAVDPETNEIIESVHKCKVNQNFESDHEIVLRKSTFQSDRTFGFFLNRGSNRVERKIIELLQKKVSKLTVTIFEGRY